KPRERLKAGDEYRRQAPIAAAMIRDLHPLGCHVEGGLADSLDGEATPAFVTVLETLKLPARVVLGSHHAGGATARASGLVRTWADLDAPLERWPPRNALSASRHLWSAMPEALLASLTPAPETWPAPSTAWVMVAAPDMALKQIGDRSGFRTWIEAISKPAKEAFGGADFRVTRYEQMEKWWALVMSAFLMVSLLADPFNDRCPLAPPICAQHPGGQNQRCWKH
ncbi:MAG: IS701 family transposase, partial [Cyanobacteria bacterium P01_H01_bin.153]